MGTQEVSPLDITDGTTAPHRTTNLGRGAYTTGDVITRPVDWSDTIDQLTEEAVLQISGVGHWFLEGWIDHSVDFLVDSGSAVTALSCSFY